VTAYYGKYRGKVENNVDLEGLGRLQVSVSRVTGSGMLNWAMPSVPFAGKNVGFWAIPPKGANVWVEYEEGNADFPIWSGCFWGKGELPVTPAVAGQVVLKTNECTLTLSDLSGKAGITIQTKAGMKIEIKAGGIELSNGAGGTIEIKDNRVMINKDGLEVK
jgi:uncharacterized protein involved in type VI secretion and phage assembly